MLFDCVAVFMTDMREPIWLAVSALAASVMPLAIRQGGYAATTPSGRFSRLVLFLNNRDGVLKEVGDFSLVVKSVRHPRAHLFLKGLSGG